MTSRLLITHDLGRRGAGATSKTTLWRRRVRWRELHRYNQPQVAILGTGAISQEPKGVAGPDGEDVIAVRSVCYLPLTYDHRLVDGAEAGRFVSAIRQRLEEGAREADLGL